MPGRDWSNCGGLRISATENLTALVGLEVLFKAVAATEGGRDALRAALEERLADMAAVAQCGLEVDEAPNRVVASQLREMVDRIAPIAA
jgi:hypothetical protein